MTLWRPLAVSANFGPTAMKAPSSPPTGLRVRMAMTLGSCCRSALAVPPVLGTPALISDSTKHISKKWSWGWVQKAPPFV